MGVLRARVSGAWVDIPTIGAQGPAGTAGAQGPPGSAGAQGPAGPGVAAGGSAGQVLTKIDATNYNTQWTTPAVGSGDVVGPASATDNAVVRFDATTGKLVQNSTLTVEDNGIMTLMSGVNAVLQYGVTGTSSTGGLVLKAMPPHGQTIAIVPRSDVDGASHVIGALTFDSAVTMKAPLVLPTGTAAATSLNFGTAGTGLTGASSQINFNTAGAQRLGLTNTDLTSTVRISAPIGTAASTAINFGTSTTGLYAAGAFGSTSISMAIGGANKLTLDASTMTMTAPVALPADPASPLHAATKQYVDAQVAAGGGPAKASVSDTAPGSPATGQLWFDSDAGKLFIYYDASWVQVGAVT